MPYSSIHEPSSPNRDDIESPLLQALQLLGGKIRFSDDGYQIEGILADRLHLSQRQREFFHPRYRSQGNRKWRNEIQFVRDRLANKGHLDRSQYDIWEITVQGYHRLQVPPHAGAPDVRVSEVPLTLRQRKRALLASL